MRIVVTTVIIAEVLALVDNRKIPPAQVAEGQDHLGH